MFENPFASPGNWYRANLHAHTTLSDGSLSPPDCLEFYRRSGYHILALTDHWHVAELDSRLRNFLVIKGAELDGGRSMQESSFHIVGLNLRVGGKVACPQVRFAPLGWRGTSVSCPNGQITR